jgi:hypothetical protein
LFSYFSLIFPRINTFLRFNCFNIKNKAIYLKNKGGTLTMIRKQFLTVILSVASILLSSHDAYAVNIDAHTYCLTCKEGCSGAAEQQCKRMCMDIKEHVANLQMSRLTNETGKKFRTLRNKAEKADMLYDSPLYKCLGLTRAHKTEKEHEEPKDEKNTACAAALQNVEEALQATLYELQNAKKMLVPHHNSPGTKSTQAHSHAAASHEAPPPPHHQAKAQS